MNNIIKRVWNQNRLVNIEDLTGMVFQAEADGHTFEISGIDDTGAAVELSGAVAGVFRRPDNADIALTGAASDGVVSVTLSEDCYAVPGRFGLTIFVTSDSQKVAVYACVGTVAVSSTGNVAGDTPASVEDLIEDINAAIADLNTAIGSIPADYSQFMASIAPTYSSSALYGVGSYAWHDGTLYRCTTPITTAETWTAAHWTAAVLGDDVGDLKSAVISLDENITGIKDDLYKEYNIEFKKSEDVSSGDYSSSKKLIDVEIPEGAEYTFKLTSMATKAGNMSVYEIHSDATSKAVTYNYTFGSTVTAIAAKPTTSIKIAIAGGGFTSAGSITVEVVYSKKNAESFEGDIDSLEGNTESLQESMDAVYHDYVTEIGYDMISEWINGNIDSNGNETEGGSYYRTNKIDVEASKTYYLAQVAEDSEGTTKVTAWGNNTYGIVHCYSGTAYLGVATNSNGLFTPLENTTKVCIANTLIAATNIHMYELNGNTTAYREDIVPTDHDDTVVKSFDTATIKETKLSVGQMDFTANSGMTLVNKETAAPWFLWSNYIISAYIPFSPGSYYIKAVINGLTSTYIKYYDEDKSYLSTTSLGSYQTPTKFVAPGGTHYIRVIVAKSSPKLSDLTEFCIYRYTSKNLGYSPIRRIVNVNTLPELPPTATTGRNGSGILCLGHGGLSSVYSEDSIESFYGLAHNGFDGSEVDIQFTKDHVPVCWHDGSLGVLEGASSSDHIYDYTLAELDANFDFRTWWDKRNCFRSTVARFEEVCILARAYGWHIMPDKLTGLEADRATNMQVLIDMIKKYGIQDKFIVQNSFPELRAAFPDNIFNLTAMQQAVDETWINGLLNNTIPTLCHQDGSGNMIVNDGVEVMTGFNWAMIKEANGVQECANITDLMTAHNVKTCWYTCETPEDIYQLVQYCPKTHILLTGLYTIPDGINKYIGMGWGNKRDDLSGTVYI